MTVPQKAKQHIGLLLAGGGARAAYQVGVLKAVSTVVPRNYGTPFPILSGTSAGAINSTALACYASCYHLGIKKLEWVWRNFTTEMIYKSDMLGISRHILRQIFNSSQAEYANQVSGSWFNNQPLRVLLNDLLDFKRIDQNIINGYLKAISVNTSSYTTGDSVCFFQAAKEINEWHRSRRRGQKALINVEHLMASSAIPLVFPSISIQHEHYGDGAVHQMAPLSPPVHLGAKKIFIIGMSQPASTLNHQLTHTNPPSAGAIAGHLLDTIFNEALNSDLERLHRVNSTLKKVKKSKREDLELKKIKTFQINPSENFNQIASKHYHQMPFFVRSLLGVAGIKADAESSIVSYLLFEKAYTQELIDLGYKDGMAQIDAIADFLELNNEEDAHDVLPSGQEKIIT